MKIKISILSFVCLLFSNTFSQNTSQADLAQRIAAKKLAAQNYISSKGLVKKTSVLPTVSASMPEQDCNSAIPVCQNVYNTVSSYSGSGNIDEIPGNTCLATDELNSVWYTFTSNTAGNLAFQISPNNLNDDYDFALYDITNANCTDIASGALTPVRCNYASQSGATGLSSAGVNPSEDASGFNQSTVYPTSAGKTYVLIISNYSSTQGGYSLDFSSGTASIFDNVPPTISTIIAPCGSNVLTLQASEQVRCNSIASNGSDFMVTGTGGPYTVTAAAGVNCGANVSQVSFTISPALSGVGPWTIGIQTGTDTNTLLDACGNAMIVQTQTFVTSPPLASITGPSSVCKGSLLALTASLGSSYNWTGSAVPSGQNNQQTISLNPNTSGTLNFTVQIASGTCGTVTATKAVTVKEGPIADFVALPSYTVCAGTAITFSNTTVLPCTIGGSGISICTCGGFLCLPTDIGGLFDSHVWNFGDGGTSSYLFGTGTLDPIHTYTAPGVYNVNLTSATSAGLGSCPNTISKTITVLPSTPNLTVSPSVTICPGTSVPLEANGGLTYTWTPPTDLSSTNTNTTVASPTTTTIYTVSAAGCVSTTSQTVEVAVVNIPPVLGPIVGSTTVCPNVNGVMYSINHYSGTTYNWTLPSGVTLASSSTNTMSSIAVNYSNTAGTISVSVTNACGTSTAQITVSMTTLPINAVASPSAVCSGNSSTLTAVGGTTYTWSPSNNLSATTGSLVVSNPTTVTVYTVTGMMGVCSGTTTVSILIIPPLLATITQTNASCNGSTNGAATATPSVTGSYTYLWSTTPTQTTQTATGLGAGTYSVTITDTQCHPSGVELIPNGDFSLGNTGFSSSYTYTPPPNTLEGEYWVGTNASTWNPGMSSFGDHTSGSGNFMIVNGAPIPNTNVYCQTVPVTPNTNYLFSTWLSTLNNGVPASQLAQLQFYVNGIPLGNIFTAPATTNTWSQFASSWNSGSSTSANICIVNQSTSALGNDFGLDDISFQECTIPCPATKTVTITQPPAVVISVSSNTTICEGQSTSLSASGGVSTFTWSPSATLSSPNGTPVTATPINTTTYTVTGSDASGCTGSNAVVVNVNPKPNISINSFELCAGKTSLSATGANTYTWNNGINTNTLMVVTPNTNTTYTVSGTSAANCTSSKTIVITPSFHNLSFTGMSNSIESVETILQLQNTSNGYSAYTWITCLGVSTNSTVTLPLQDTGVCCVSLIGHRSACDDTLTKCITVIPKTFLDVPNVFTPNGDGHNDVFILNAINIGEINMTIYDRWGLKMFNTSTSGNIKWDGKTLSGSLVSDGTYFYILKAKGLDGKEYDLKGTINVFR